MRYNAYFEMSALLFLIVIAVHFFTRKRFHTRLNRFFGICVIVGIVDVFADVATSYMMANPQSFPMWLIVGSNEVFFLCQAAFTPILYLYCMCMTGAIDEPKARTHLVFALLPAAACVLAVTLNPLTNAIFYFTDGAVYSHGPYFIWLYAESAVYLIASAVLVTRRRRFIRNVEFYTLIIFIAAVIASIVFQAYNPQYLVTGVALSLAIVMMYLTMQNPEEMLDSLTGAFNRNSFFTYIDGRLRRKEVFQAIVFDISGMGAINKLFGINVGDRLLSEIGGYLRRLGSRGQLFRMVGDSFVLVTDSVEDCEAIIAKAQERFTRRWSVGDIALEVNIGICYSLSVHECADVGEVKALMGRGMTLSDVNGRRAVEITREMHGEVKRSGEVEALLRRSLDEKTVEMYLQPIYKISEKRVTGMEALARLRDESGRIVMPAEFIPIAERTGLVTLLGEQMIDMGCGFLRRSGIVDEPGFEGLCINLSVIECIDDNLVERICDAAERYDIPPNKLCFEVTETTATLSENLPERMEKLCALGYNFALDDFGTGYANYDSIMRLPFCAAKFDKSMLDMSAINEKGEQIFFSTIDMVSALGYVAVVEGVETAAQAELLERRGVNVVQGFYFARPMTADEFTELYFKPRAQSNERRVELSR